MTISLDQAIEIHALALYRRKALDGRLCASEEADRRLRCGDREGAEVWRRVQRCIEAMRRQEAPARH